MPGDSIIAHRKSHQEQKREHQLLAASMPAPPPACW